MYNQHTGKLDYVDVAPKPIECTFDGGGSAVAASSVGYTTVPHNMTLNKWTVISDVSATLAIDVWLEDLSAQPPTNADTITGGNEPAITAATYDTSSDLSGWTSVRVTKGQIMGFNVDSNDNGTYIQIMLEGTLDD
jgi:hypothetical protein